ncbi:tRNA (5-methylaminomethyl-2-thiouridylate)-methyltransferase [Quadrisphaera granulorum]|uniref:tRNA-specific 2-thiouridylase MnmA n=1 Tax=Quadrisphaera granulorum TaxID=317664 RepID=A0A316AF00_9ACTN|nr:tRNA 2-thiouridine(34) synthase MnmA [Quadrisphaera granulorum]PWJ56313.1 tRNA (5-methylaminomethyl-2-thiouridylate)-methyltransferase [Quadrisphaera granulorum]SZE94947.1 tRNA (5-methylaminomethyl-2-thiouridylate)-methyltransferase [Quadrisphaera granulorum]
MRVLAALSGGVDSAVAAARAVDAGHEVVAVHLALASASPSATPGRARGCCTIEDSRDARRAADVLGIPFYVWDLSERFGRDVVDDFVAEYAAGRTPNPCVRCNQKVKFAALADRALALGFDAVATGHYARIVEGAEAVTGTRELHRSHDLAKDQSYVLAVLPPHRLATALFPLGTAATKDEVRAEAAARGLALADKPDSTDICFVPDGDTRAWLGARLPEGAREPGDVVDSSGRRVGTHDGAAGYTVGQRRGLRLGVPAADGKPRYVLSVSVAERRVVVGSAEELAVDVLSGDGAVWCGPAPQSGQRLGAQVRAHGAELPCTVEDLDDDGGVRVRLDEPARGVAPGQLLALYDGTRVVGSATLAA